MKIQELAVKEWEGEIFEESLYHRNSLGVQKNVMSLLYLTEKRHYVIEWTIGEYTKGERTIEIGVWAENKKVIDYDGVFELPKEAIQLLQEQGFDTKEVEE